MKVRLLAKHYIRPGSQVGSEHDVSEDEAKRLISRGVAEAATLSKADAPSESWTVRDLRAYADDLGIDLGDATRKADILATIAAAG